MSEKLHQKQRWKWVSGTLLCCAATNHSWGVPFHPVWNVSHLVLLQSAGNSHSPAPGFSAAVMNHFVIKLPKSSLGFVLKMSQHEIVPEMTIHLSKEQIDVH